MSVDVEVEHKKFHAWRRDSQLKWTYEEWAAAWQGWLAAKRDSDKEEG